MSNSNHPYETLPSAAFWRSAIAERNPLEIEGLWRARFPLSKEQKVITAGSCFAQHISRALQQNGFNWLNAELAPAEGPIAKKYGYGVFSFRTANIYTVALLKQWVQWALGEEQSQEVWEKDGRYFDPFRPAIEPNGFSSPQEMHAARVVTLDAVRRGITDASVFVFTLGLTEAWVNSLTRHVYPMAPGTLGGTFDSRVHAFHNYRHSEIYRDMSWVIETAKSLNPSLRFILTVSPVPLTATASGNHILSATTYSKSTLRAVAGDLLQDFECVDYFPSYEIIFAPIFRGMFYQPNAREVSIKGVEHVMTHFFAGLDFATTARRTSEPFLPHTSSDVECEEATLEAFGELK